MPLESLAECIGEGKKYDDDKLKWHLLPLNATEEVVKILMYGANKYGENNWQRLDDFNKRYFNAAIRHLMAWQRGEEMDPESGLPHLAHATCSLFFLLERELARKDEGQLIFSAE